MCVICLTSYHKVFKIIKLVECNRFKLCTIVSLDCFHILTLINLTTVLLILKRHCIGDFRWFPACFAVSASKARWEHAKNTQVTANLCARPFCQKFGRKFRLEHAHCSMLHLAIPAFLVRNTGSGIPVCISDDLFVCV